MKIKPMLNKTFLMITSIYFVLLLTPSTSLAATIGGPIFNSCDMNDPRDAAIQCVLSRITTWSLGVIGSIIILMIIISGFMYITSAGNPTQTERAKKTLVGAIIGLIIVSASGLLVTLVPKIMGLR